MRKIFTLIMAVFLCNFAFAVESTIEEHAVEPLPHEKPSCIEYLDQIKMALRDINFNYPKPIAKDNTYYSPWNLPSFEPSENDLLVSKIYSLKLEYLTLMRHLKNDSTLHATEAANAATNAANSLKDAQDSTKAPNALGLVEILKIDNAALQKENTTLRRQLKDLMNRRQL